MVFERRWIVWALAGLICAGSASAQTIELIERGMKDNNSGRTAAKVFKERAKKLDRTPREDWESQEGFLGTARVERLDNGELRICVQPTSTVLESKRSKLGRDESCWRAQGRKKPTIQFIFGRTEASTSEQERHVSCKIRDAGTFGFFDVHVLEKEVIHEGHCTFRASDG